MKALTAVVIGAGQRGRDVYGAWAAGHPDDLRVVAVCDTDPDRVELMTSRHAHAGGYPDLDAVFAPGRIADVCIIATPDRHHHEPAARALDLGYHVLLEKPMAHTREASVDLVRRAERAPGSLHVAHVLRYTPFFRRLNELLPAVGEIVNVDHRENVAAWHMAHSFVRGNWSKAAEATPMIVQKSCHDFDILTWNIPSPVTRLVSFGSLLEFRAERAPRAAAQRCLDCPVDDCPYDARTVYLDPARTGWPVSVITSDLSEAGRRRALRDGPYGVCAYRAGSDVVDNQVVAMEFSNGATATLTMHGHAAEENRTMRYDGTRGSIRGLFGGRQQLELADHRTGRVRQIDVPPPPGGHGGGDHGIMESFVEAVVSGRPGPTEAAGSLESHLLAFAAEQSRVTGETIDMKGLRSP